MPRKKSNTGKFSEHQDPKVLAEMNAGMENFLTEQERKGFVEREEWRKQSERSNHRFGPPPKSDGRG